jgi:hypothetical protein
MPYVTKDIDVDVSLEDFETEDLAKELANRERFGSRVVDIDDLIEMLAQWGCPEELMEPIRLWGKGRLSLADLEHIKTSMVGVR